MCDQSPGQIQPSLSDTPVVCPSLLPRSVPSKLQRDGTSGQSKLSLLSGGGPSCPQSLACRSQLPSRLNDQVIVKLGRIVTNNSIFLLVASTRKSYEFVDLIHQICWLKILIWTPYCFRKVQWYYSTRISNSDQQDLMAELNRRSGRDKASILFSSLPAICTILNHVFTQELCEAEGFSLWRWFN